MAYGECLKPFRDCEADWGALKAPGEAEAELAYLNRVGILDAVLTDDVDAFLFGAVTIIRK
jgi:5'-3' exonuclease